MNFIKKIIMSDMAQFHLNGAVNRQNCRILAAESSHFFQEKALHLPKVNV